MVTKYFIAPFPPPLCFSRRLHRYHRLHLRRLGEEIERPHGRDAVGRAQPVQVAGQRGRVARDVDQSVDGRSEEHTSELQSRSDLVCRLLLEKKKKYRTHLLVPLIYVC